MKPEQAKAILESAIEKLLAEDIGPQMPKGFPRTIGERPLVARLALYMIQGGAERNGLNLDCDYNRHGKTIKELLPPKPEPGMPRDMPPEQNPKRFFPDIVLHSRGNDDSNVLVCEIKRSGDHRDPAIDRSRLVELTTKPGHFGYDVGAFLKVDQEAATVAVEYFEGGRPAGNKLLRYRVRPG